MLRNQLKPVCSARIPPLPIRLISTTAREHYSSKVGMRKPKQSKNNYSFS
uniref:Uncharacterized protein n=1 Tax=uncultured marine virus TaxID=186617 RepID=A0A0F7L8A8_9VIRU|nr:hypothetical protein [uncultured marine virus]